MNSSVISIYIVLFKIHYTVYVIYIFIVFVQNTLYCTRHFYIYCVCSKYTLKCILYLFCVSVDSAAVPYSYSYIGFPIGEWIFFDYFVKLEND